MNRYTPKERAEIVTIFIQCNRSVIATQRAYRKKYRGRAAPKSDTIRRLASNFETYGSVANRQGHRPRPRRSKENIRAVERSVTENPNVSYRRRSQQLKISGTSLRRILKDDLHMFPFKVQLTQRLLDTDNSRRVAYANTVLEVSKSEPDFWERFLMTDEAHFMLSGTVNKQNCRFWGKENPHAIHQTPLHDQKVTVWAGVCSETIIGPFFFHVGDTVNGDRYRWMLAHSVLPAMREKGLKHVWFQQDGATCHTAKSTMKFLQQKFPGRVVSKGGDIDWPPRSPDLTAPDFFLWGFLKSKVYANKPKTLDELKNNIRAEIAAISPATLANVMQNAKKRAEFCLRNNGGHLIDIVF